MSHIIWRASDTLILSPPVYISFLKFVLYIRESLLYPVNYLLPFLFCTQVEHLRVVGAQYRKIFLGGRHVICCTVLCERFRRMVYHFLDEGKITVLATIAEFSFMGDCNLLKRLFSRFFLF